MIVLDDYERRALRYACWRGRRYTKAGFTFDTEAFVHAVTEVLTPILLLEVTSVVGVDEVPLDELWNRVEQRTAVKVREVTERVLAKAESEGIAVTDDPASLDRALEAALGLYSVNEETGV